MTKKNLICEHVPNIYRHGEKYTSTPNSSNDMGYGWMECYCWLKEKAELSRRERRMLKMNLNATVQGYTLLWERYICKHHPPKWVSANKAYFLQVFSCIPLKN